MSEENEEKEKATKLAEDLKGFEEVTDLIPVQRKKRPNERNRLNENFALLSLLEYEQKRLEKIDDFFSKKTVVKKDFDQSSQLIRDQKQILENLRGKIEFVSEKKDSMFMTNLAKNFNTCFGPARTLKKD